MFNKYFFTILYILLASHSSSAKLDLNTSALGCPFLPAEYYLNQIEVANRRIPELELERSQTNEKIKANSLALQSLNSQKTGLQADIQIYEKLLHMIQEEINRVYYSTRLLQDMSEECQECLTLGEVFEYVQLELPEEYWSVLKPLKDYLAIRDEMVEAESKRLIKAIETFSSEVMIHDLEEDILLLTETIEDKKQKYDESLRDVNELQLSLESSNERLNEVTKEMADHRSRLRENKVIVERRAFAENMCFQPHPDFMH